MSSLGILQRAAEWFHLTPGLWKKPAKMRHGVGMTLDDAKQKFNLRWTLLGGAVAIAASLQLLQLSRASAFFATACVASMTLAGCAARGALTSGAPAPHFMFVQRGRMIILAVGILAASIHARNNRIVLLILAAAALWLISVSGFLQIGMRYAPTQARFFPYVQFFGDLWIAIFLAIWGVNWMYVAGVLAVAAASAIVAVPSRDTRMFPVVFLSTAALFLFGIPPASRGFAIYLIATLTLCAWSAHHMMMLANHLRSTTASAWDGSAVR